MIRSRKYLAGSRGAPCTLRIAGVCTGDTETTVPAHIRDRHTGRSIKASDLSVADSCFACHEVFDGRAKMPGGGIILMTDWLFYALRGLQETLERRVEMGLLIVSQDATVAKTATVRKPRGQRKAVLAGRKLESRPTVWPSRPFAHQGDDMSEDWVKVGAEVVEVSSGLGSTLYGPRKKIAKVYKNGNFIVDGNRQWRPFGDYAVETGGGRSRHRFCVHPVTEELLADMAANSRLVTARNAIRAEIERLEEAVRSDDAVLEAYAALRSHQQEI